MVNVEALMLREIATHNAAEDGFLCLRQRLRLRWRRPQRLRQCLGLHLRRRLPCLGCQHPRARPGQGAPQR